MSEGGIPEPGQVVAWLIVYGERRRHWACVLGDKAKAQQKAADLRGVLVDLLAGAADFSASEPGCL